MTYTTPSSRPTFRASRHFAEAFGDQLRDAVRHVASDRLTMFLALLLVTLTVLSAQALNPIDHMVNNYPRIESELLRTFLIHWPDTVASRAVALPVLVVVTFFLALRTSSWRPIVLAFGSVFTMIFLVASMKLVIGRSHPRTGDPAFFADIGQNFSFPSGHGANSILIYGVALYLIVRYGAVRPHIAARLGCVLMIIVMVQGSVSAYLRFHWATDLLTGMIAGALVLRMTIVVDGLIPESWSVGWWPFLPVGEPRRPLDVAPVPAGPRPVLLASHPGGEPTGHFAVPAGRARQRPWPSRPLPTHPARARPGRPPRGDARSPRA